MAAAMIDFPDDDDYMVGMGVATYNGNTGFAIGGGRNWFTGRDDIEEISAKVSTFFSDEGDVGVGGSVSLSF